MLRRNELRLRRKTGVERKRVHAARRMRRRRGMWVDGVDERRMRNEGRVVMSVTPRILGNRVV